MPEETNRGIKRKNAQEQQKQQGKNYLFVVGIDDYKAFPKLYNAVKDAKDMINLLTERYNFEKECTFALFNKEATQAAILHELDHMADQIEDTDNLLMYFSGHGEYKERIEEGFWIPYDGEKDSRGRYNYGSFLSFGFLKKYVKAIKSLHTFIIADSCYSGTLFAEKSVKGESTPRDYYIPSRYLLTAGRNEVVSDGKPGDNSPFADSLLWHLRNNNNLQLSVAELCEKVKIDVSSNAAQIPRYGSVHGVGHRGGSYYFRKKDFVPTELPPPRTTEGSERGVTKGEDTNVPQQEKEAPKKQEVIEDFDQLKRALKGKAAGSIKDVFELLDKHINTDSSRYNDFIYNQGRFNGVRRQADNGEISEDFAQRTFNQIRRAVLHLIDELEQSDVYFPGVD